MPHVRQLSIVFSVGIFIAARQILFSHMFYRNMLHAPINDGSLLSSTRTAMDTTAGSSSSAEKDSITVVGNTLNEQKAIMNMESQLTVVSELWQGRQKVIEDNAPPSWREKQGISIQLPLSTRPVTVVPGVASSSWWKGVEAGKWEPFTWRVFHQEIHSDTVYVGFGEWVGVTGLYAMQVAKKVILMDADPAVRGELTENVRRNNAQNQNVALDYRCINDKPGTVTMKANGGSGSSIAGAPWAEGFQKVQVDCISLPQLLQEYGSAIDGSAPLFIKIDTEGAEAFIVPSLKQWLQSIPQSKRPTIFLSMHHTGQHTSEQYSEIASVLNLYPYYGIAANQESKCTGHAGVFLNKNPESNYFRGDNICVDCDYLLVADDSRALVKCQQY